METSKLISLESISLKNSPDIDEPYIQEYIANDPSVLGLGDVIVKVKEKIQPKAGRLDFLLQDSEENRRFEVEIQLGKTDESHIIRTIEYWDNERKRYPQFDHCAVIVAEDLTGRFFNVIQLFNGHIPLIAIQMSAFKVGDKIALKFTKILDELKTIIDDDEDDDSPPSDRKYWETKGSKEIVDLSDEILKIINEIEPNFKIKYNKYYIGLVRNGIAFNFVVMRAKRKFLKIELKLEKNDEIDKIIDENELDVLEYNVKSNRYKIRLVKNDLGKRDILKLLLQKSYDYFS
jgi:predicted transport protein